MSQDILKGNCLLSSARSNWRIPRTKSRLICAWRTQQQQQQRHQCPSLSLYLSGVHIYTEAEGHNRNEALEFYSHSTTGLLFFSASFWPAAVFTPHKYIDFTLFCARENV
jgi:hypothetical protein